MLFHNRLSALIVIVTAMPILPMNQAPRRDFRKSDFKHLQWIEGTWRGEAAGGEPFYERYHYVNDSTIQVQTFKDASLRAVTEQATLSFRNGRIIDESAKSRWEAVRFTAATAQFIPVRGANNSFQFTRLSKDRWNATIIPAHGRKKTVYEMRRM